MKPLSKNGILLAFLISIFQTSYSLAQPISVSAGPNKAIYCGKDTKLEGKIVFGPSPTSYCSVSGSGNVRSINWVEFNTISNVSNSTPKVSGNVGSFHQDFTSIETDVVPSKTYKLTVWGYVGSNSGNSNAYITALFDWNRDGDFADAGEAISIGTMSDGPSGFNQVAFANITIPPGASLGKTRMRIFKQTDSYSINGCGTINNGQVEDYTINIAKYQWSPATGLSATDIPNPKANPTSTQVYTLIAPGYASPFSTTTVNVSSIDVQTGPAQTITCSQNAQLGGVYYIPLFQETFDQFSDYNLETTSYSWGRTAGIGEWDIFSHVGGFYGSSGKGLATFRGSNALSYQNNCDNIAYHRFPIDATQYTNLRMSFKWKAQGERSGSGTWYDYGKVVYSLDGTTWVELPEIFGEKSTWQDGDVAFPAAVNNQNFYIGFKWKSNGNVINRPGFVIDNIMVYAPDNYSYSWSPNTNINSTTIPNPIVSPKTTTNYTLTMSYPGCVTQSSPVTVTVNPLFNVGAGAEQTICSNLTTELNGSYTANITPPATPTIAWSPGATLSSTTSLTPTASPTSTTNYTLTVSSGGCVNTDQIQVNVVNPVGNPSVFGPQQWYVYAYNAPVENYTPATTGLQYLNLDNSIVKYAGWYQDNTLSINTSSVWGIADSPDQASSYAGCPVNDDNHVFVYKRKGFPCGTYQIGSFSHDDAVRIIIDGVMVYETTTCCSSNPNLTVNLGGTSEVEIRVGENTGASYLTIPFTLLATTLAQNNDTKTCYVGANSGWNTFSTNNGRTLVSINPGASTLGNVEVTAYVAAAPLLVDACLPIYNLQTAVLNRRWTITPTSQPTNNVRVRLYIGQTEHAALVPVSNGNSNPDDQTTVYSDLKLSKYHHPTNVAVNGNFADNCANIGPGSMSIWNAVAANTASSVLAGFDANGRYLEYELTSPGTFSEFWLHGSQTTSPLPITMAQFSTSCENGTTVNWSTASEKNVSHFEVYRSRDGESWNLIDEVNAVGNSHQINQYAIVDNSSINQVYYKLRVVDIDGASEYFGPIVSNCSSNEEQWYLFPNPTSTQATIEISSSSQQNGRFTVMDMSGKLVQSFEVNLVKGVNQLSIDVEHLARGTYILHFMNHETYLPIRFIKQ